jgi:hypothetical protein
VRSLEASFLETQLDLWQYQRHRWPWEIAVGSVGLVQEEEFDGGCQAHVVAFAVVVAARGCRILVGLAACSGPRLLALLSGCQCGTGMRRKTAFVATTTWDDQACSGLRWVAQLCWSYFGAIHRWKTAHATSLAPCHGSGSHACGFINKMKSTCGGGLAV